MANFLCGCAPDQKPLRHAIGCEMCFIVNPPTVIVDNNMGYITYHPVTQGYQSTSLRFSCIHECMGFNFYATNESIGACVFKEGTLFSVADRTLDEFFGITGVDGSQVTIITVLKLNSDTIYIAAVLNIGDSMIFSSKTISYRGMCLTIPVKIQHFTTTKTQEDDYKSTFDENGELIGSPVSTDDYEIVSFDDDNGSHGFGDFTLKEIDAGGSIIRLIEQVVKDLKSFSNGFDSIEYDGVYSIESYEIGDSVVYLALTPESITAYQFDAKTMEPGDQSQAQVKKASADFKDDLLQTTFDNVYSKSSGYYPPIDLDRADAYKNILSPAGIIKRYKGPHALVVSRVISGGIGSYEIPISNKNDEFDIDKIWKSKDGKKYKLGPTKIFDDVPESSKDKLRFVFYTEERRVNTHVGEEIIAAKNWGVIHEALAAGSLPHQKADIIAVKSMSNFMSYTKTFL